MAFRGLLIAFACLHVTLANVGFPSLAGLGLPGLGGLGAPPLAGLGAPGLSKLGGLSFLGPPAFDLGGPAPVLAQLGNLGITFNAAGTPEGLLPGVVPHNSLPVAHTVSVPVGAALPPGLNLPYGLNVPSGLIVPAGLPLAGTPVALAV